MSYPMIDTIRSFADGIGLLLGVFAAVILGYLRLGDWLLETGRIGSAGDFAGVTIAFIGALFLTVATVMIFIERLEGGKVDG